MYFKITFLTCRYLITLHFLLNYIFKKNVIIKDSHINNISISYLTMYTSLYHSIIVHILLPTYCLYLYISTRSDLPALKYLTLCIKEAQRLHTPVPYIERITTKPTMVVGRQVPAGTVLTVQLFNLHQNPAVWEDPLVSTV
jgi:hypothetical protein